MSTDAKIIAGLIGGLVGCVCFAAEIVLVVTHWTEIWAWWMNGGWGWEQWAIWVMMVGPVGWKFFDRSRHLM